jgi:SH3-like domain-containing protein
MNVWRGIASIASVTPLLALVFHLQYAAAAKETWRITDIAASARIHLREEANNRSKIIAYIPGTARGLSRGECEGGWCEVEYQGLTGWVFARYLARDAAPPREKTAGAPASPPLNALAAANEANGQDATAALATDAGRALNKTEPTATQVAVPAAALQPLGDIDSKSYTLAGLGGQSSLAMREQPDGTSRILGWIPNRATDVQGLRKCVEKWCLVRHGAVSGWVARRHLADAAVESTQMFQAKGVALWGAVDVLDYPNPQANVVGKIPSYATGIVPIGGCDDEWCHVRYLGIAGWVSGEYLEPQAR